MAYNGPGKIVGFVAVAGLLAIFVTMVYSRVHPDLASPDAHYDQVFKYCTEVYVPNDANLEKERQSSRFKAIASLSPGAYQAGGDGYLYIFGGGMFQIALPSQLQVVRNFGSDVQVTSSSQRPRNIIGCRPEQMSRALEVYGMDVGPFISAQIKNAPETPAKSPPVKPIERVGSQR